MPLLALKAIPWRLIGILIAIALVAGVIFLVLSQAKEIGALRAERTHLVGVANKNAQIAENQYKVAAALRKIAADLSLNKDRIRANANKNRQEISDAPATDDGPLAPVLQRSLDRLRWQGTGAGAN